MLSNVDIQRELDKGVLQIVPFVPKHLQPASYDLTLDKNITLKHGVFQLASTNERVIMPGYMQGQVHGRSSIGRMGVIVHFTAGFVDPKFSGTITLEMISWNGDQEFFKGDRIAQIAFDMLISPANPGYEGRYQYQNGLTPSRFTHDGH